MRLGIYGGSFDPVHYGHLLLAECCREHCQLDEVWFLPAAQSPLKQHIPPAPANARLEMLKLAIGGHPQFQICRLELDRGGISYTVDTLATLREQDPSRELFFLLGSDTLRLLPMWREPVKICELATLVVVNRGGEPRPDFDTLVPLLGPATVDRMREHAVEMPEIDLHSSELRRSVAEQRSIRYRTPRAVEEYIGANGLYRTTGATPSV